jgi:alginate export protein
MRLGTLVCCSLVIVSTQAVAQGSKRATGLPKKISWTFNLDAGLGAFGFNNSLYRDVRPDPVGDLSDNWFESYAKPALSGTLRAGKGQFFGKISAVGERTYSAPPPLVGSEASSFMVEDLYIGWRSGKALSIGENALQFTFGRAQYRIGHGLFLWDGGGEGGTRGGFWSNARKAWALAGIARFHAKKNTLEGFYLDRNEVPEAETGTRVVGGNYERAIGKATTLGATYAHFMSDSVANRDGLNVVNVRAYSAPLRKLPNLSLEVEYAREDNGDLRKSTAWNVQGAYELSKVSWTPKLSYRYAYFQGDDPATAADESFDMLFPGFYDWGTWWQGEIGGEYFLSNSNLISHQVRVHVKPSESVGAGLFGYVFKHDQLPPGITSKDVATEFDAYADWSVNSNFIVSFVAALAHPQAAVTQASGRTSDFTYGMIYVAYAY